MNDVKRLEMYGGFLGSILPLLTLITGLIWLSVMERGGTQPFWACGWIAIVLGLFLAKNKAQYCEAIMRGISDKNGIVIITAWLFAGVFGKIMVEGGLVNGLLWMGITTGAEGAMFTCLVFLAAMLFSLGTGTSTGTTIALSPVLYPAGYFLGADPAFLALAILSGAAFGDNLAPVSDTTIVSAYTQDATMRDVVKSRFPLAICAAGMCFIVFAVFGGGGAGHLSHLTEIEMNLDPKGLFMLLALAVVVITALLGRHIIEALIYGNVTAALVALATQKVTLASFFSVPATRGLSTGIIENGIISVVGAIIFALLILAVTNVLVESGIMKSILDFAHKAMIKTVRQAELFIVGITILVSIPISANAPALLLVGPSIVKPMGRKFGLSPQRRANLMDCAVCTIFFTLPWHIVVAAWYAAIYAASETFKISAPPVSVAFYNPYSWALLAVLVFSVLTGWNRTFAAESSSVSNIE